MVIDPVPSNGLAPRMTGRGFGPPMAVLAAALTMAALGSGLSRGGRDLERPAPETREAVLAEPAAAEPAADEVRLADAALEPWRDSLAGPLSRWAWTAGAPQTPVEAAPPADSQAAEPPQASEPPRTVMTVPLPVPRPPELRAPGASGLARRAERQAARRQQQAVAIPQPKEDDRSFFEKLFGVERSPALSYAALESRPVDVQPQRRISPPLSASPSGGTAVYNIAARTVTLPSGERLEAHSGLGEGLDEPRLVNVRMRGPTPPGTYDLTEREQLFHGVRAIRLNPVGGSEAVYGRVGLLAHTFMLGPRGDSNGCVSFRDYDRFLQAFLRGEVQRLVVVTGTQDAPPSLADRGAIRMARNGG